MDATSRALLQDEMTRLADGDREAFRPAFERLWPLVRAFAARQLPSQDAEDAAQRAMLRLFERASEFDSRRDALAWSLGVAAWEIRTVRRWRGRRREVPEDSMPAMESGTASPEDTLLARERDDQLRLALASLQESDRDTLRAWVDDESEGGATFRKRLQRARERLRHAWRTHHA